MWKSHASCGSYVYQTVSGRTSVPIALIISIFELGHKMGFNSIEMLLFQPRPKSRLIINPTKHVGKAFFLDRMINLQELGLWSWLEELGHTSGPNGGWKVGPACWMGWQWAVNLWGPWDVQLDVWAVFTSVAARTLCIFVEVDWLCWLSVFKWQYLHSLNFKIQQQIHIHSLSDHIMCLRAQVRESKSERESVFQKPLKQLKFISAKIESANVEWGIESRSKGNFKRLCD